jgi:hypothetical protein
MRLMLFLTSAASATAGAHSWHTCLSLVERGGERSQAVISEEEHTKKT